MPEHTTQAGSRHDDSVSTTCTEEEFAELLADRITDLSQVCRVITTHKGRLGRRILGRLLEAAAGLDDFLDDHGASNNSKFAMLSELLASVRGWTDAAYMLTQLELRYLQGDNKLLASIDDLSERTAKVIEFAEESIQSLLDAVDEEMGRIYEGRLDVPDSTATVRPDEVLLRLPGDLDGNDPHQLGRHIARIASMFIGAQKTLVGRSLRRRFDDPVEMRRFVLEVSDEEQCRFLETKVHNILAHYDTFVRCSAREQADADLQEFHGVAAATWHLLRVMTRWVQFYERHEDELRSEDTKARIAEIIGKDAVLDGILNFCLLFLHDVMEAGAGSAAELVERYTERESVELEIPEGCMLHARPASLIAKIVMHHGTPVEMEMGSGSCYAGSIMQVILLAGRNLEDRTVRFTGDAAPISDLRALFESGLGETSLDDLPDELNYLKP